jgi:hypothetical protein
MLATELGVPSSRIVKKCQDEGLDVRNHMSTISVGLAATIREWFSEGENVATAETAEKVGLEKSQNAVEPQIEETEVGSVRAEGRNASTKTPANVVRVEAPKPPIPCPSKEALGRSAEALIERLLEEGKRQGYLTYEQVNASLPDDCVSASRLERLLAQLDEMGIALIDEQDVSDKKDVLSKRKRKEITDKWPVHQLQFDSLPDEVDYLRYLAAEMGTYLQKRKWRERTPHIDPSILDLRRGIQELQTRLRQEEARKSSVPGGQPEAAETSGVSLDDTRRGRPPLSKEVSELGKRLQDSQAALRQKLSECDAISTTSGPLAGFSKIRLMLFRVESAIRSQHFTDAYDLMQQSVDSVHEVVRDAVLASTDMMRDRLEFLGEVLDAESVSAWRARLETLRSDRNVSLKDQVERLEELHREIEQQLHRRHRVVCKVNVFRHGHRDVIEVSEGDTLATLADVLKRKYAPKIEEYLYGIHHQRISGGETRVRFYSVGWDLQHEDTELPGTTKVVDIAQHDSDGVFWYPEWVHADESAYRSELHTSQFHGAFAPTVQRHEPTGRGGGGIEGALNTPIRELDLSVRASSCLESAKLETVRQLVQMTEADLLRIRSFGKTSLREIKRRLADMGLSLGMSVQAPPDAAQTKVADGRVLNEPIGALELPVRATRRLASENIETVRQLVQMTEADLLKIRNFTVTSLREVKRTLADKGLSLGMSVETLRAIEEAEIERKAESKVKEVLGIE